MTRRRKILLCVICGLIAVVAVCFFGLREQEPSYNGRTLSEWLERHMNFGTDSCADFVRQEAETAIRHIGTNAIPSLLKWNNATDSNFQKALTRMVAALPASMGRKFLDRQVHHHSAQYRHLFAAVGFGILGTNAVSALPVLGDQFRNAETSEGGLSTAISMIGIGAAGIQELASIISTNSGNQREIGIVALQRVVLSRRDPLYTPASNALMRISPGTITNFVFVCPD